MIPYDEAPDESAHFHYSVEFIVLHHRLPVAGVDDRESIQLSEHTVGGRGDTDIVYPQLNYFLSALTGVLFQRAAGWELYRGARIASLLWGLVFLNFLFLCCHDVLRDALHAAMLTFAVAFIPQILFLSSYVNSDIHSLALSAAFSYFALRTFERPSRRHIWAWAVATGLFCSAKYNYVVYGVVFLAVLIVGYRQKRFTVQVCRRILATSAGMALLLSGFWYLRNYRLYGDPFGLSTLRAILVQTGALVTVDHPLTRQMFRSVAPSFAFGVFESFFAEFGRMALSLSNAEYAMLSLTITLTLGSLVLEIVELRDRHVLRVFTGFLGFFLINLFLLLWFSFHWDYQPQGRYLFPVLMPFSVLMAYAVRRNPGMVRYVYILCGITAWLLMLSNAILIQKYGL